MKLLPDICIDGYVISLQDPFVVDKYIVKNISIDINIHANNKIKFFTSGLYGFEFDLSKFWHLSIEILKRNYMIHENEDFIKYEDDTGVKIIPISFIERDFCEWIKSRHSCGLHNSNIISRLKNQHRIDDIFLRSNNQISYIGVDEYGNVNNCIFGDVPHAATTNANLTHTNDETTSLSSVDSYNISRSNLNVRETYNDIVNRYRWNFASDESSDITYTDNIEPVGVDLSNTDIDSVTSGTLHFENGSTIDVINSNNSRSSRNNPEKIKDYIHPYNYIPDKYIKHYMANEDKNSYTTLLLGVEIEVGDNDPDIDKSTKNNVVKKCIQIMNGNNSDNENLIYSTHDGTVQIELDTMPCSIEFHKQKMNYKELFKYLDQAGYKGHDCKNAGLHIHANREYLGKTKLQRQLVISKILYIIEKFNDEICVIGRRSTYYSQFVGDRANEDTALNLFNKYTKEGKRAALNLMHKDTIEFRMFKSTLKYETFMLTLEFVKDIIDFAKNADIEKIEMITWRDLMQTFSDELQKYYNDRYNKMLDKNIDKKIEYLKKLIASKKNDIGKAKNYIVRLAMNKELSKLQTELKKCETKRNKENKEKVDIQARIDARGIWNSYAYLR